MRVPLGRPGGFGGVSSASGGPVLGVGYVRSVGAVVDARVVVNFLRLSADG